MPRRLHDLDRQPRELLFPQPCCLIDRRQNDDLSICNQDWGASLVGRQFDVIDPTHSEPGKVAALGQEGGLGAGGTSGGTNDLGSANGVGLPLSQVALSKVRRHVGAYGDGSDSILSPDQSP
jgi:hypothetical protein